MSNKCLPYSRSFFCICGLFRLTESDGPANTWVHFANRFSIWFGCAVVPAYLCQLLLWSRNKIWHLCCWELDGCVWLCVRLFSFIVCVVDAICLFIYITQTPQFASFSCSRSRPSNVGESKNNRQSAMHTCGHTNEFEVNDDNINSWIVYQKKGNFSMSISHQPSHNTSTWIVE